jgi:TolB-like protein
MEGESPELPSTPPAAVFLSYASEDAQAALRLCSALRASGIEVWLDQSELRGGDAWDRQIRERIHDCRLFIALISAHTEARDEGYFRREWKLAVDRTHDMLEKKAFLLPVAIDATPERGAAVPDKFHEVQWTRLPGGEAPPEFVARIKRLLSPEPLVAARSAAEAPSGSSPLPHKLARPAPLRRAVPVLTAALVLTVAYLLINKLWISKRPGPAATATTAASSAGFNPPAHSVAVLPFVNLSGDASQDYFSDGLTEELLNSLAQINHLQVAARTSSFSFKEHPDIGTVAHKLNVAAVLEGSVRRSAHTVRVTAQLVNAVTGFHLWSRTFDRDLGDVLELQSEIATAVASAMRVTLLGDEASRIEQGGTRNPAAFDAYLRGLRLARIATSRNEAKEAIAGYTEAIASDPNYAQAYAARSLALSDYVYQWGPMKERRESFETERADAERAITLAPESGEAHAALARFLQNSLDYQRSWVESEKALELAPGNAVVLYEYSQQATFVGRAHAAVDAARRGVTLDPLNPLSHRALGDALWFAARSFNEALAAYQDSITADPIPPEAYGRHGLVYYGLGNYQRARASCAVKDHWESWFCLALTYGKLRLDGESNAQVQKLGAFSGDDAFAYQYAQIYAQRGDRRLALEWLDKALRLRDPGFRRLKTDPLMDPLRGDPRFQTIQQGLNFPD